MSLTTEGIKAEQKARKYLFSKDIYNIQQLDWLIKVDDDYYAVEVKERELFQPPPILGTGLDISQIKRRTELYNDLGIDTILLVFEKGTNNIYKQYLSVLEQTPDYYDTKNKIRIYNINHFTKDVYKE